MMKFSAMTLFFAILFLQIAISMDSNVITTNQLQENETVNNLNIEDNQPKEPSKVQKCLACTTWSGKFALMHPFSFFLTGSYGAALIFKYQAPLGVIVCLQYSALLTRFSCPNWFLGRKLNAMAKFCKLTVPLDYKHVSEESENNKNDVKNQEITVPIISDADTQTLNPDPNVKASSLEVQPKKENAQCKKYCAKFWGHLLMHHLFLLLSCFASFICLYEDDVPFGVWMTIQMLIYFARLQFPKKPCCKRLNEWAKEIGAGEDNIDPNETNKNLPFNLNSVAIPKDYNVADVNFQELSQNLNNNL